MGSVVAQAFMVGAPEDVSAYVLSGTMGPAESTEEFVAGMRAAIDAGMADEPLDALAGYNASDEPTRTSYDWLSRDEDEVDKYIVDPLCGDDNPLTYGYVAPLLETIADVMEPDAIARIPKGFASSSSPATATLFPRTGRRFASSSGVCETPVSTSRVGTDGAPATRCSTRPTVTRCTAISSAG